MEETEQCECCQKDLLAKDMICDKGMWLCKQCAMDLKL